MSHHQALPFLLFMVIIAKKTTFLISLHKQIFCLPKDGTYKTCENIFKGQFVQSSDKHVYFSLDLIKEWVIMSQELLYERTVVGGFELLASLCPRWSENRALRIGHPLGGMPCSVHPCVAFLNEVFHFHHSSLPCCCAGNVSKTEIATMYHLL